MWYDFWINIEYSVAFHNNMWLNEILLKFIYSEKATKFCEFSTVYLTVTKALTKYERPKMKRDACQKYSDSIFGEHLFSFSAVHISLRLYIGQLYGWDFAKIVAFSEYMNFKNYI